MHLIGYCCSSVLLCGVSLWETSEAYYSNCYWCESGFGNKAITPSLSPPVYPATGRSGARLSGPGPRVPAHLFHLFVLSAEKKWGSAQRRLLLHCLVCHHRNTRLQVSQNTIKSGKHSVPVSRPTSMSLSFNTGACFLLSWRMFQNNLRRVSTIHRFVNK